jgi:sulfite reductase alpha subunit-like flavoprotein
MKKFWKFLLRKNLPADSLSNLKFGVIGLGDSSYQKFNYVAKRLYKRLVQLGAHPILPIGLCDDQHDLGIGAVLIRWLDDFWKKNPLLPGLAPLEIRRTRWQVAKTNNHDIDENIDIYGEFEESPMEATVKVLVSTKD